jgi:hypothetical protein
MIRLKHFGVQIEVNAVAPIMYHEKINALRLRLDAKFSALHVFADLNAITVDCCQQASVSRNGIFFELFWTHQSAKSWDLKRSSPAKETFNIVFNGALIQESDCVHFGQISSIVTVNLFDAWPKKRLAFSEDTFIQATACITCNWEDTYKHRGTPVSSISFVYY